MADINNPQVNDFLRRLRVDMEDLNQLQAYLRDTKARYDTISQLTVWTSAAASDRILDGRGSDGVSRLTKDDAVNAMAQVDALLTQVDTAGAMDTIRKPMVRGLRDRRGV